MPWEIVASDLIQDNKFHKIKINSTMQQSEGAKVNQQEV